MDYHFEDDAVMDALVGTNVLKNHVSHHLHTMTSGEKWSLYRAVVGLAKRLESQRGAEEVVKHKFPEAHVLPVPNQGWIAFAKSERRMEQSIGYGNTEAEAWENAAEQIPVCPVTS